MEQTLLSMEHLKKSYDDNLILDDINLEVHQGEVIVLVGPSGCGKSTMLRCINALEPIQGGEIKLNGEKIDPKNKNIAELRQKIGMVFQSYELFPHLTVLDNILLAPMKVQKRKKEEAEKEAMALLERAKRRGCKNRVLDARSLLRRLHAGHLRPRHHRRTAQGGANDGQYPIPCCLMVSAIRSRWGQRLGQKKAAGENNNLCKQKDPKPYGFGSFWHAVRDSNPRPSGP